MTNKVSAVSYGSHRYNPREIQEMIVREAKAAHVDPRAILAMIHIETGGTFNPYLRNASTGASGLGQFMPVNLRANLFGLNFNNVFDPVSNIRATIGLYKSNMAQYAKRFGGQADVGIVYLMHQQGAGGASHLLKNANSLAAQIVGKASVLQNGGHLNMTAGQFANLWISKARNIYKRF